MLSHRGFSPAIVLCVILHTRGARALVSNAAMAPALPGTVVTGVHTDLDLLNSRYASST
jgi:hypothetical protein